jgi:hypothetical protein
MDATTGMSPSLETIAAGMAGFALASLFSFARKPQVVKQDTPPTSYLAPGGHLNSYVNPNTPATHFPGMGHDFHVLARLVGEKQQSLNLLLSPGRAEQDIHQMLKAFRPQLAEFSSFEWRANLTEMVGLKTHIVFGTNSLSQSPHSASHLSTIPALPVWSERKESYHEPSPAEREVYRMRSIENAPEENPDGQRNQRRRKCCGRDDEARRTRRGWCRGRDEDTSPTSRGWFGPREDYRDRWGWSRYREEIYN